MIAAGDTGGNVYILEFFNFGTAFLSKDKDTVLEQVDAEAGRKEIWEELERLEAGQPGEISSSQQEDILKEQISITCKCGHNNPVTERWCKNCGREL